MARMSSELAKQARRNGLARKRQHRQAKFLAAYRITAMLGQAAEIAGISPSTHFAWKRNDPIYSRTFDMAHEETTALLKDAMIERSVHGIEEPTGWYKGKPGGTVRRYSDTLLMFAIKQRDPSFNDKRQLDVNVHHSWESFIHELAEEEGDEAIDVTPDGDGRIIDAEFDELGVPIPPPE